MKSPIDEKHEEVTDLSHELVSNYDINEYQALQIAVDIQKNVQLEKIATALENIKSKMP